MDAKKLWWEEVQIREKDIREMLKHLQEVGLEAKGRTSEEKGIAKSQRWTSISAYYVP